MAPRRKSQRLNESAGKFGKQDGVPAEQPDPVQKEPPEIDRDPGLLDTLAEREKQLGQLLRAEHNQFSGVCSRMYLRNVAETIRNTLAKDKNNER